MPKNDVLPSPETDFSKVEEEVTELIQEATALRSEVSLSQGQVAAKLGMSSHSHIAAIETGRVVPRLNTFLRILSLYDHTIKIVRKDSEK